MVGHFTGFGLVHPTTGATPHDVVFVEAAGQVTAVCITCETFQTLEAMASGAPITAREGE